MRAAGRGVSRSNGRGEVPGHKELGEKAARFGCVKIGKYTAQFWTFGQIRAFFGVFFATKVRCLRAKVRCFHFFSRFLRVLKMGKSRNALTKKRYAKCAALRGDSRYGH